MPQTKFQNIVYTVIMAIIMVYGMIVYNVALNTGGVTNATFVMALHEMPIMVPIAIVLEFFVVEKLATRLAFTVVRPTDRLHHVPHHEPDRHPAVQGTQLRHLGTDLGLQHAHGPDLAASVRRSPDPADLPQHLPRAAERCTGAALNLCQNTGPCIARYGARYFHKKGITAPWGRCR